MSRDPREAMTPERWREVKDVLHSALDLPAETRAAFLDRICKDDDALRAEVDSLLAASEAAGDLLERGVLGAAFDVQSRDRPPLMARVSTALAAQYRVERELCGGGMSRVFVATELALGRQVVVKVLPPELQGAVSAERFRREIRVAARMQHPHIVPLLSASDDKELLYFVMPFIEGESLRSRLERDAGVPRSVALGVLRDVADALAYAHDHGVVHRDIKPANILLTGPHALVADFGVAKAIAAAAETDAALTSLGSALGTPAYMAPEQVVGDHIDVRTDLYAWGVLAYELLSGRHPFAGKTTVQQLVGAQLSEVPASLGSTVADISPELVALVNRCLAKDPAQRPGTAHEIVQTLDDATGRSSSGLVSPPPRSGQWRRPALLGAAVAVLLLGGYALIPPGLKASTRTLLTRSPPEFHVNRVVVAPLVNETGDPELGPLGPMAADLITEGLSHVAGLEVIDASTAMATAQVVSHLPRLFRPGDAGRALAEETGSKVLVTGSFFRDGDSLRFRTKVLDAATGNVLQVLPMVATARGTPTAVLRPLAQRVAVSLRAASEGTPFGTLSMPTSMAAYDAARQAYDAVVRQDTADLRLVRRAVELDSTFGAAVVLLPYVAVYHGDYALADSGLVRAARLRDRLSPFEQAFLDFQSADADGDGRAMVDAAERASRAAPRSVEAKEMLLYSLAARNPRRALRALGEMDPDRGILLVDPVYWQHVAFARAALGELSAALTAIHQGERRFPESVLWYTDAALEGRRHDTTAATSALEHLTGRFADQRAAAAAAVAALLRVPLVWESQDRADRMGRAFANGWISRLGDGRGETVPAAEGRLALLAGADRWGELLAAADSLRARPEMASLPLERRAFVAGARAVALLHLGQRARAVAIDSSLRLLGAPRRSRGAVQLARARIAAHEGNADVAAALLAEATRQGWPYAWKGLGTAATDPFLLPLRSNAAYQALIRPALTDARATP